MICNSCGRDNQNQNANFCEYCGASLREGNVHVHETETTNNYSYQSGTGNASAEAPPPMSVQAIEINDNKKPVSYLNWLGTYFIMLIPFVGGIVFFVMLIVWATSSNTPESKKNWARATLTFMIIMLVLALILVLIFASLLRNPVFQDIFQDSFNSEFKRYNDIFRDFSY
ncbi:MAG: zinc ribbon domain-containing protein [Clostridiales bacterium]|jgi:hypothetical protein|nr:zinc ribbon domain-containing protein [Clostridiales bacterium]